MSRTYRRNDKPFSRKWGNNPGRGKYLKERYNRASRRQAKQELDHGRAKSLAHQLSEVKYHGW